MLMLKIMGLENAADGDTRKTFRLLTDITSVDFNRRENGSAVADVTWFDRFLGHEVRETYDVGGNAYVMNEHGKTVASFGAGAIEREHEL